MAFTHIVEVSSPTALLDEKPAERKGFSERLQHALRGAGYSPDSPTYLAREFNFRFPGRPVTVHAARKWLVGESIPTQEKLRTLAQWLGVSAEWLRFGAQDADTMDDKPAKRQNGRLEPRDLAVLENLSRLDDQYRYIVQCMIRILASASDAAHATDASAMAPPARRTRSVAN